MEIPLKPMERIIRNSGHDVRSSKSGCAELAETLEVAAFEIGTYAKEYAKQRGKKTIKVEDIRSAYKRWKNHKKE